MVDLVPWGRGSMRGAFFSVASGHRWCATHARTPSAQLVTRGGGGDQNTWVGGPSEAWIELLWRRGLAAHKNTKSTKKLDVNPQRDDDASPMSTYRCMLRPTWISSLQHKSKYKSNSISNFFEEKKIKFFGSHVVVLVKTFPLTYQLLM